MVGISENLVIAYCLGFDLAGTCESQKTYTIDPEAGTPTWTEKTPNTHSRKLELNTCKQTLASNFLLLPQLGATGTTKQC